MARSTHEGRIFEVLTPISALPMIVLNKELLLREVSLYRLTVGRVDTGPGFRIKRLVRLKNELLFM